MCNPLDPGSEPYRSASAAARGGANTLIDNEILAEKAGQYMLAVPQSLAWFTGGTYDGHSLSRKGPKWLLVVRMRLNRHPVVSFTEADTVGKVFQQFAIGIMHDLVEWRADQYR